MAKYKSDDVTLGAPAEKVFDKLSNIEGLKEMLARVPADKIPEEHRATFENIGITSDSLTLPGGPVGTLTLRLKRKESPSLLEFQGEGTPVPMSLRLNIRPTSSETCEARADVELAIPAMLAPMISGPMKKMVRQFGDLLRAIPFD